ncbi:MAG: hypothetical protein RR902_01315 [Oscillospiraceae bacterium]
METKQKAFSHYFSAHTKALILNSWQLAALCIGIIVAGYIVIGGNTPAEISFALKSISLFSIFFVLYLIFLTASATNEQFALSFQCSRRSIFLSTILTKIFFCFFSLLLLCLISFVISLVTGISQGTFVAPRFYFGYIALFFFVLSLGNFFGKISVRFGKVGKIIYTTCLLLIGGCCGMFFSLGGFSSRFLSSFNLSFFVTFGFFPFILIGISIILDISCWFLIKRITVA